MGMTKEDQAVFVTRQNATHVDVSGTTVTVKEASQIDSPIIVRCSGESTDAFLTIGRAASCTVFDVSTSAKHTLTVTLEPESELHIVVLSRGGARTLRSTLADGARIFWHCFTLGESTAPHSLVSTLAGRNAKSNVDWVFAVRGSEKQSVSARNVFQVGGGGGEITMKGVAEGSAYASCTGMIEIAEGGGGTDTYLTEDVLMLDPTAKVDAVPGLEIRTNDVKASHSATVSRVTVEDLFYFQSRGIPPAEARRMYTEGFLGDLTERIPDEDLRTLVGAALTEDGRKS